LGRCLRGVDFATQAARRPDWEFRRTGTLLSGAPYCDFRWRLKRIAPKGADET
jgi:hypothetical protein